MPNQEKETSSRNVYILLYDCIVIGAWTSLKKLIVERKKVENFPSYSKLSKEKATLKMDNADSITIEITTKDQKQYQLRIEKLK